MNAFGCQFRIFKHGTEFLRILLNDDLMTKNLFRFFYVFLQWIGPREFLFLICHYFTFTFIPFKFISRKWKWIIEEIAWIVTGNYWKSLSLVSDRKFLFSGTRDTKKNYSRKRIERIFIETESKKKPWAKRKLFRATWTHIFSAVGFESFVSPSPGLHSKYARHFSINSCCFTTID